MGKRAEEGVRRFDCARNDLVDVRNASAECARYVADEPGVLLSPPDDAKMFYHRAKAMLQPAQYLRPPPQLQKPSVCCPSQGLARRWLACTQTQSILERQSHIGESGLRS